MPDAVVVGGMDATKMAPYLRSAFRGNVPIVGWHASPSPGAIPGTPVAANVTTDAVEVARVAAYFAVLESKGTAGVVIFTDSNFEIAMRTR